MAAVTPGEQSTVRAPEPAGVADSPPPAESHGEPARAAPEPAAGRQPIGALGGRTGEVVAAAAGIALIGVMVATEWYGVAGVPDPSYARPAVSTAESGWNGLAGVRWVIVATVIAAVGSALLHLSQREHGVETDTGRPVAALGTLSAALLIYRVLISLPGGGKVLDQKLGALIGVACALAIAWGGWESIAEQRARAVAGAQRRTRRRRRRTRPGATAPIAPSDSTGGPPPPSTSVAAERSTPRGSLS